MLDESAQRSLVTAVDAAVSRCIDAYNMATEADDAELAAAAREQVAQLQRLRQMILDRPTRRGRWMFARTPRGDARSR